MNNKAFSQATASEASEGTAANNEKHRGYRPYLLAVDGDLREKKWENWKVRLELTDALSIEEAVALSFGIRPSAVTSLSKDTAPSLDRFRMRLGTVLALVKAGKIGRHCPEVSEPAISFETQICFSSFMKYASEGNNTSLSKKLIDLAYELAQVSASTKLDGKFNKGEEWKEKIRERANAIWLERINAGGKPPSKNSILGELSMWCINNKVKTKTNKTPSAATIARHVLQKWTPPIG